jgi:hypothetical protein
LARIGAVVPDPKAGGAEQGRDGDDPTRSGGIAMGSDELGAIGTGPTPLDVGKRREGRHLLDGDCVDTISDGVAESAHVC